MTGSLHLSVYSRDEFVLQGHLDISKSSLGQHWSSLPFCPSRSANEVERYFTFSGTPGVVFTVEVSQDQEVELDVSKPFEINQWNHIEVFQFIPPEDISKTQLDVTVISDSDVPAYLKVSRDCKDVKDNIRLVDYKGESIRLSFAKKGRITLSRVSIPPLTDSTSPWFIGIALNNATGAIDSDASKTGKLTLTRSFDYSYSGPMLFICFLPFFGGLVAAFWALCCFKEPYATPHPSSNTEPITVTCEEVWKAMWEIICKYWFGGGPKTYSYITCIVGCVLMVGAFQFVFADWYLMIQEGDRDHCYYNDFCYRVSNHDIPFNLMISNLAYILHAFILAVSVWYMEAELLARCKHLAQTHPSPLANNYERLPNHVLTCSNIAPHLSTMTVPTHELNEENYAEAHKRKFSFSIGYAFAWALLFEGLFSMLYHLCPSKMTFQFDAAFMFVISGLIATLIYNGIKFKECQADGKTRGRVGATNFFLGFIVPLYFLNYLGSLNHSEEGLVPTAAWATPLAIWCFMVVNWVGLKLYFEDWHPKNWSSLCIKESKCKFVCFIIGLILAILTLVVLTIFDSLPQALLLTCILESLVVISGKVYWKVCCCCCCCCCCNCDYDCDCDCDRDCDCSIQNVKRFFAVLYVLITAGFAISALVMFFAFPTTDKADTPEKSRNKNHKCVVVEGFFDYHDLWHILSSFALLMGAPLVMYISNEPPTERERSERSTTYGTNSIQQQNSGVENSAYGNDVDNTDEDTLQKYFKNGYPV